MSAWQLLAMAVMAAAGFSAGVAFTRKRGPRPSRTRPAPQLPPAPRTRGDDVMAELAALAPGDVVTVLGTDHCVDRVSRLEAPGVTVVRGHVSDERGTQVLFADLPGPWACVAVPARVHLLRADLPDVVEHGGFRYRRLRRVEVRARLEDGGLGPAQPLHLFEGPDGVCLWVLASPSGEVEVLDARTINPGTCTVWPGGQR
jgi:hypothetical protein